MIEPWWFIFVLLALDARKLALPERSETSPALFQDFMDRYIKY